MSEDMKKEMSEKVSKYGLKIVALIIAAFLIISGIVEVAKNKEADVPASDSTVTEQSMRDVDVYELF